jgi:hypothetical protein
VAVGLDEFVGGTVGSGVGSGLGRLARLAPPAANMRITMTINVPLCFCI